MLRVPQFFWWLMGAFVLLPLSVPHLASGIFSLIALGGCGITIWLFCARRRLQPFTDTFGYWPLLLFVYALYSVVVYWYANTTGALHLFLETEYRLVFFALALPALAVYCRQSIPRWWYMCWLFGAILLAIEALLNAFVSVGLFGTSENYPRASGVYSAIIFGDWAVLVGIALLLYRDRLPPLRIWRWIWWLSLLSAMIALLLSGTRGAWLTGALLLPLSWFIYTRLNNRYFFTIKQLLLISLAAIVLLFFLPIDPLQRVMEGFRCWQSETFCSFSIRAGQLQVGWQAFIEAPWWRQLLGYGDVRSPFNAVVAIIAPDKPFLLIADEVSWVHLHNNYLTFLLSKGIIGTTLWLIVILYPARLVWRLRMADPIVAAVALLIIIAFLLFALVDVPFVFGKFTAMFFLLTTVAILHLQQASCRD